MFIMKRPSKWPNEVSVNQHSTINSPLPWRWLLLNQENEVMVDLSKKDASGNRILPQIRGKPAQMVNDSVIMNGWKYASQSQIEQYLKGETITQ